MNGIATMSRAAALAIHALAVLTREKQIGHRRMSAGRIARMMKASEHHLAKVFQQLARHEMIESVRGPTGGVALVIDPDKTSLLEIYEAIEGPFQSKLCLFGHPVCQGTHCVMGSTMQTIHDTLKDYLTETRLSDIAKTIEIEEPKHA